MVRCQLLATGSLFGAAFGVPQTSHVPIYKNPSYTAAQRADDLLGRMTWIEKIGQLGGARRLFERADNQLVFNETALKILLEDQNGQIGFGANLNYAQQILPLANEIRENQINNTRLGIPFITVQDTASSIWINGGTLFPGTCSMGATWNVPLYRDVVAAIRDENLALGIKWVLSPEVDLARDPRNGRNGEMYGEDAHHVGEFASEYIRTNQEKDEHGYVKVATTIKHFVYGSSSGGINTASIEAGINHIFNTMAAPFIKAFREADPMSLMTSYASVDQVPMSTNKYLVRTVLRGMMGFKGLIMSDAYAIRNMYTQSKVATSYADAALQALRAGLEHELNPAGPGSGSPATFPTLLDSVNNTEVAEMIDDAVRSMLIIKFKTGTFDLPLPSVAALNQTLRSQRHLEISRKASDEAVVLMKNDGILPLSQKATPKVAVLGPYADVVNSGSYSTNNASEHTYGKSIMRSLKSKLGEDSVQYVQGVQVLSISDDVSGIPAAVAAAKDAGLAVVVLGSGWSSYDTTLESRYKTDGEGFSHPDISFPGKQQELLDAVLDAGVPTVLIISGSQQFLLNNSTMRCEAIVNALFQGEFTGDAVADIIFGDVNPSGKLTMTFPQAQGAFPINYDYFGSDSQGGFSSSVRADWWWPILTRYAPMRFGFGLSYTTFDFSSQTLAVSDDAKVSKSGSATGSILMTVNVKNTGDRAGKEVVQLYYRPAYSQGVEVPVMKLIRFTKIELAAGESKDVTLTVPIHELGYYVDTKWRVNSGLYEFWVGSSSRTEDLVQRNITLA
ncbi:beta-glucosidase [Nemania abortiva]|nr:beta-glucosidase [Nemania abortiva]